MQISKMDRKGKQGTSLWIKVEVSLRCIHYRESHLDAYIMGGGHLDACIMRSILMHTLEGYHSDAYIEGISSYQCIKVILRSY